MLTLLYTFWFQSCEDGLWICGTVKEETNLVGNASCN